MNLRASAAFRQWFRQILLAHLREALHGGHQLVELLGPAVAFGDSAGHAIADVGVEHVDGDLLEGGLDGRHLREDVDAVGVLVDHSLEAADLSLDPAEAVVGGSGIGLHGDG
jgi:hypothetical protein